MLVYLVGNSPGNPDPSVLHPDPGGEKTATEACSDDEQTEQELPQTPSGYQETDDHRGVNRYIVTFCRWVKM